MGTLFTPEGFSQHSVTLSQGDNAVGIFKDRHLRLGLLVAFAMATGWGCTAETGEEGGSSPEAEAQERNVVLGPVDGHDLPASDLERVAVGDVAPDFSLRTLEGDTLTLSDFRGRQNVLLVFYRGHW
jgi:hypothetical protein